MPAGSSAEWTVRDEELPVTTCERGRTNTRRSGRPAPFLSSTKLCGCCTKVFLKNMQAERWPLSACENRWFQGFLTGLRAGAFTEFFFAFGFAEDLIFLAVVLT